MANNKRIQESFDFNEVRTNGNIFSEMSDNLIKYNHQRNYNFLRSFKTDIDALYFVLKQYVKISKHDICSHHSKWNLDNGLMGWYTAGFDAIIEKPNAAKTIDSWETVTDIESYKTLLNKYNNITVICNKLKVDDLTIKISPDHGLIIACDIADKFIFCYYIILTGEYDYTETKLMSESFDFNKMVSLS